MRALERSEPLVPVDAAFEWSCGLTTRSFTETTQRTCRTHWVVSVMDRRTPSLGAAGRGAWPPPAHRGYGLAQTTIATRLVALPVLFVASTRHPVGVDPAVPGVGKLSMTCQPPKPETEFPPRIRTFLSRKPYGVIHTFDPESPPSRPPGSSGSRRTGWPWWLATAWPPPSTSYRAVTSPGHNKPLPPPHGALLGSWCRNPRASPGCAGGGGPGYGLVW